MITGPAVWVHFDAAARGAWVLPVVGLLAAITLGGGGRRSAHALLRALAIVLMGLALLDPVIERPRRPSEAGAVLLMIDASRSMTLIDQRKLPAQRVSLARALGRLPEGAKPSPLDELHDRIDRLGRRVSAVQGARAELDYAHLVGRHSPAARANLEKAALALADECRPSDDERLAAGPRLVEDLRQLARPAAGSSRDLWLNRLRDLYRAAQDDVDRATANADADAYTHRPEVHAAADEVATFSRLQLARLAATATHAAIRRAIGPDLPVFSYALGAGPGPISLNADEPLAALSRLPLGQTTDLSNLIRNPLRQDELPLAAVVFSDGRPVNAGPLSLDGSGASWPVFPVQVASPGGAAAFEGIDLQSPSWAVLRQPFHVRLLLRARGLIADDLRVTARLGRAEEVKQVSIRDNQTMAITFTLVPCDIGVNPIEIEVESIAGEPSPQLIALPLRRVLVVDRPVRVAVVGPMPVEWAALAASLPGAIFTNVEATSLASGSTLQAVDVLFVTTMPAWSASQWEIVHRAVRDGTVSLLLTPAVATATGPAWLPHAEAAGSRVLDAIPHVLSRSGGPDLSHVPVKLSAQGSFGQPLLSDLVAHSALLQERRLGGGRVLTMTFDFTTVGSTSDSAAALVMAVLQASVDPPPVIRHNGWELGVDPLQATAGGTFRVRCRGPAGVRMPELTVSLEGLTIAAAPPVAAPHRRAFAEWTLSVSRVRTGTYTIGLKADPTVSLTIPVTAPATNEFQNLDGRSDLLRRIARSTGGVFYNIDDLEPIAGRIRTAASAPRPPVQWRLAECPSLLAVIVGLLLLNWTLRKAAGAA